VRYWDTSALVPLFVAERPSLTVERWLRADPEVVVWIFTRVELLSALARRRRAEPRATRRLRTVREDVIAASTAWSEVTAVDLVRRHAERLVESHPLRSADALQLGAALVAADGDPTSIELVTLDVRLADAGRVEGFRILTQP
jgi:predicted nucleic acid-binding protein